MANPYGTQGAPNVGLGIPGLPRRGVTAQGGGIVSGASVPRWGVENPYIQFPSGADWSQGFAEKTAAVNNLPSGFGLFGYESNMGGIATTSGNAFLMTFTRSGFTDVNIGLFVVTGELVTLVDYKALSSISNIDGVSWSINYVRTEWADTFIVSAAGLNQQTGCAHRWYVVKVNEKAGALSILADSYSNYLSPSQSYYNRGCKTVYLRDGYLLVGGQYYYSSGWQNSSPHLLKITENGLSYVFNPGVTLIPEAASFIDGNGRFVVHGRSLPANQWQRYLLQLNFTTGAVSVLGYSSALSGPSSPAITSFGGEIIVGKYGTLCWPHRSARNPITLMYAGGNSEANFLAGVASEESSSSSNVGFIAKDSWSTTMFADGAGDGALVMQYDSVGNRQLCVFAPFMLSSDWQWKTQFRPIKSFGNGTNRFAVHLGNRIFCMAGSGVEPMMFVANKPY